MQKIFSNGLSFYTTRGTRTLLQHKQIGIFHYDLQHTNNRTVTVLIYYIDRKI